MGPEDNCLPPDNFQETPEPRVAHRTSPTNIGMGLLATLAAHDLGFIDTDELARRIDATLTTIESLERHEGHLLNWYDTRSLAPLLPALRLDRRQRQPGGALMTLAEGLRARRACRISRRAPRLSRTRWASASSTIRSASFSRSAIRLADAEGPGRLDTRTTTCSPPRRASRASSRSRKGDVPETHWFHLGPAGHERRRHADAAVVERHRCSST